MLNLRDPGKIPYAVIKYIESIKEKNCKKFCVMVLLSWQFGIKWESPKTFPGFPVDKEVHSITAEGTAFKFPTFKKLMFFTISFIHSRNKFSF